MSEQVKRRRVFVTAGLTASAAVLAMAVQAGLDDGAGATAYSSSVSAEPDQPDQPDEPDGPGEA